MTTALRQTQERANGEGTRLAPQAAEPRPRESWFERNPAWPVVALLAGWPLWWILGFNNYAPVVFAIPMAYRLYRWQASGTRSVRVPPGFGLWLMFLVVTMASVLTLGLTAPGTVVSPVSNRVISFTIRTIVYLACTVILLYAGNLEERELPRRRLAFLLGLVGIYTVAGGIGGVILPNAQITSPLAKLVPQSLLAGNGQLQMMLHPATAQVMTFLGYAQGRPAAPFSWTNMWGNVLAITLPWLFVAWWCYGTRKERRYLAVVFAIGLVPVVYSLDRGLWIGLGFTILYLAVRFAARGKATLLAVLCATLVLAAVVIAVSPLHGLISQRLSHGRSNTGRASGTLIAIQDGASSPLVGYGDTRHEQGSASSITLGRTANCKACGQSVVGGDGQLQLLLICVGVTGAFFYISFFGYGIWRYRRDRSPYGMAGLLVLMLGFIFMFVYEAVGPPLAFTFLSYALLWRGERERRQAALAEAGERPGLAGPGSGRSSAVARELA